MVHKKKRPSLTYVISSHPKYQKALNPLLDSMYVAGGEANEILVVLNDCQKEDLCSNYNLRSGISYVTIKNNIFEYGSHIGIVKAVEDGLVPSVNDFVIIHDTCLVGKNFKKKCLKLQNNDVQIMWAASSGTCIDHRGQMSDNRWWSNVGAFNLGIYRYQAIKSASNLLKEMTRMDKHFAIEMEHAKNYMSPKMLPVSQSFNPNSPVQIIGQFDVYSEGKKRDVAYLKHMDLYKFFLWVPHGSEHPNRI